MPEDPVLSSESATTPTDEADNAPAKIHDNQAEENSAMVESQSSQNSEPVPADGADTHRAANVAENNVPADNVPAENVSADNVPAENVPAENVPAENLAADTVSTGEEGSAQTNAGQETPAAQSTESSEGSSAASEAENNGRLPEVAQTTSAASDAAGADKQSSASGEGEPPASEQSIADSKDSTGEDIPSSEETEKKPEEFAKLLEKQGAEGTPREVKVGERVRGKIVSIQDEHTFIDFSGRSEAMIATSEIRGKDGEPLLRVGDILSASVVSIDDGVALTLGRKRGALSAAKLRIALENQLPVSGTVRSVNKGGFDVNVGGVRAFCPLSQIDTAFVEDPKSYVGKSLTFRVLRWEDNGRNIVISRRSILKKEAAEKAEDTRKHLEVGAEFEGSVTRIQPFGAFVDIGGLEGLLHVSRMSYGHIDDPASVLKPGQKIRTCVVKIEGEGRKQRIALALADLGPDPWENLELQEGEVRSGKVMRLTTFGAFVQLDNGIDGLVHISELSPKRINHPKEAVSPGDAVEVKVLRIDHEKRRVSLSIRQTSSEAPEAPRPPKRERPPRQPRAREKPGPAPSGQVSLTHNMAEQLGALKHKLEKDE